MLYQYINYCALMLINLILCTLHWRIGRNGTLVWIGERKFVRPCLRRPYVVRGLENPHMDMRLVRMGDYKSRKRKLVWCSESINSIPSEDRVYAQ
jgi:hypothetical protein